VWMGEDEGYSEEPVERVKQQVIWCMDRQLSSVVDGYNFPLEGKALKGAIRFASEMGRYLGMHMLVENLNTIHGTDIRVVQYGEGASNSHKVNSARTNCMNYIMDCIYNRREWAKKAQKVFLEKVANAKEARMLDGFLVKLLGDQQEVKWPMTATQLFELYTDRGDLDSVEKLGKHIAKHNLLADDDGLADADAAERRVFVVAGQQSNKAKLYNVDTAKLQRFVARRAKASTPPPVPRKTQLPEISYEVAVAFVDEAASAVAKILMEIYDEVADMYDRLSQATAVVYPALWNFSEGVMQQHFLRRTAEILLTAWPNHALRFEYDMPTKRVVCLDFIVTQQ
jgi:hypothetical protein